MNEILKTGSIVKIKNTDIKGFILGVIVRGTDYLEYHISYFNDKEHKQVWLFSFEIEPFIDNSQPAGFKTYDNSKLIE